MKNVFHMQKSAALIYGQAAHYLDHLVPIASLLQIPLIVTEKEIAELGQKYYPDLQIILSSYKEIGAYLVQNYEAIFYCIPRPLFDEVFFFPQKLMQKKVHTIWCPHGNSDKGYASPFMEGLSDEEYVLIYGQKMLDFFKAKRVFSQLKAHIITGNFRYTYYKKHKEFFLSLSLEILDKRLNKHKKTILYAPTWDDAEQSSSFFEACPKLVENLKADFNLIIKVHPNLLLDPTGRAQEIINTFEDQAIFLTDFPLVYPLLELTDIYVGDMSSIGYDFLTFNRPLFFLNQNRRDPALDPGLYLYQCGVEIRPEEYSNIFEIIEKNLNKEPQEFSERRKKVYEYTFGSEKPWDQLQREIHKMLEGFPDKDLDFF